MSPASRPADPGPATERVVVGRVGRAHGIRGDVAVSSRTDEPRRRFAVGAVVRADDRVLTVAADVARDERGAWTASKGSFYRTARRLFSGQLWVPAPHAAEDRRVDKRSAIHRPTVRTEGG